MSAATKTDLFALIDRVERLQFRPPRHDAIAAIRVLETALVEALQGQTLRGLPNLGTGRSPFPGANVRSGTIDARVPFPKDGSDEGSRTLVLRPDGKLALAWTTRRAWSGSSTSSSPPVFDFHHHGASEGDLLVEDLAALINVLPKVLTDHLSRVEHVAAGWEETRELAHRVLDLATKGRKP